MITRRATFVPLFAAALLTAGATAASAQPRDVTREITRAATEASREAASAAREIADALREAGFASSLSARDIDELIDDLMRDLAPGLEAAGREIADSLQSAAIAREVSKAIDVRAAAPAVRRYQGRRDNRVEQTDRQTRTVKVGAGGLIELRNIAGDITVSAGGGDTATIEITKIARGSSEADARELLALVPVDVVERAGRVEVTAKYPNDRSRNNRRNIDVTTAYRVTTPAGTRIKTDSISGEISVTGIKGDLSLNTISGNVRVEGAGTVVNGQSISGNVELISAAADAVVELSSTSGNVSARGVKVRRLDLGSISGSVRGQDLQCDSANLHTISGNVEYGGALVRGGSYEFQTHSGDVRLSIGGGTGFELQASTFSGEVRSGLTLKLERSGRRTIRGSYGDAAARIEASSFSGTIVINGR